MFFKVLGKNCKAANILLQIVLVISWSIPEDKNETTWSRVIILLMQWHGVWPLSYGNQTAVNRVLLFGNKRKFHCNQGWRCQVYYNRLQHQKNQQLLFRPFLIRNKHHFGTKYVPSCFLEKNPYISPISTYCILFETSFITQQPSRSRWLHNGAQRSAPNRAWFPLPNS